MLNGETEPCLSSKQFLEQDLSVRAFSDGSLNPEEVLGDLSYLDGLEAEEAQNPVANNTVG